MCGEVHQSPLSPPTVLYHSSKLTGVNGGKWWLTGVDGGQQILMEVDGSQQGSRGQWMSAGANGDKRGLWGLTGVNW